MEEQLPNNGQANGYGLTPPSKEQVVASLQRFMESSEALELWANVCTECGFSQGANSLFELETAFKCMSAKPGLVGVAGKSMLVRTISYKILSRTSNKH